MDRLRATIPAPRIAPYEAACSGTGVDAMDLYRWANDVALAVFDDIGTVEIAMRSAMAQQLAARYGLRWYENEALLDDDTLKLVRQAVGLGRLASLSVSDHVRHGKLVATLMFGFWVKILGRGGYQGKGPERARRYYDEHLWKPALRGAFPAVEELDRRRVEKAAHRVQLLRNRVAHHEHIVWGVPLIGERRPDGKSVRLSLTDVHGTLLALAGYVAPGLQDWLVDNSRVTVAIAGCPLPSTAALLL